MSDALPLPSRPSLEQYRKLAKDLQRACKSGDETAVRKLAGRCTLTAAQFFFARAHGFASWPKFAGHLEALARADSPVSKFEAAADAIVQGDIGALAELLRASPQLARARSNREHRSTLLHYVSANGVEDFRQTTPGNIVEIARRLLQSGADVNAESDAYGGRSTALGLTATSLHPEKAGLQIPLLKLLIAHGASIERPDGPGAVNACLRNGRKEAAAFLADAGARLDLEGAAGVGRLDLVRSLLPATEEQMRTAFAWTCEFGRTQVAGFLLDRGVDIAARLPHHGQTGLHWAACRAEADTVKLLLRRGAPVDAADETHGATPLAWTLHAFRDTARTDPADRFYPVVTLLVEAGARVEPDWLALPAIRGDPRMLAALARSRRGE